MIDSLDCFIFKLFSLVLNTSLASVFVSFLWVSSHAIFIASFTSDFERESTELFLIILSFTQRNEDKGIENCIYFLSFISSAKFFYWCRFCIDSTQIFSLCGNNFLSFFDLYIITQKPLKLSKQKFEKSKNRGLKIYTCLPYFVSHMKVLFFLVLIPFPSL